MKMPHQDLKPQNVLLNEDNKVKLSDFALLSLLQHNDYDEFPYYKSPQLLNNEVSSKGSDIWALGCIIYELCFLQVNSILTIESI